MGEKLVRAVVSKDPAVLEQRASKCRSELPYIEDDACALILAWVIAEYERAVRSQLDGH